MVDEVQEYPKWVKTKGESHPDQPGYKLVHSADDEEAASAHAAAAAVHADLSAYDEFKANESQLISQAQVADVPVDAPKVHRKRKAKVTKAKAKPAKAEPVETVPVEPRFQPYRTE